MLKMSTSSESLASYVKAACSYQYEYKGQEIYMSKDEVFLLINRATEDWWQVIRDGEKRAFFAPRKYLEPVDVSVDVMMSSLRKKKIHQRHLQHQQRFLEETRKQLRTREVLLGSTNSTTFSKTLNETSLSSFKSIEKNEVSILDSNKNESLIEKDDLVFNSPMTSLGKSCSSISEEEEGTVYVLSNELSERKRNSLPFTNDKLSVSSDFESLSTQNSISSLNISLNRGSNESFARVAMNPKMVGKAASFDVLQSEENNNPLGLRTGTEKAVSSETLDNHSTRRREFLFQSDRLTHRNRSNSVDLKRFTNNLDLSESEKSISLEKNRKCRITRDPMNRRRSWALNDSHSLNSYYKNRYDERDASMILDVPPKLPPKLRKSNKSLLSKSTDNIQEMFGPMDIKIEERKQYLFGEQVAIREKLPTETQDRKPVVFPRRILPYQNKSLLENEPVVPIESSSKELAKTVSEPTSANVSISTVSTSFEKVNKISNSNTTIPLSTFGPPSKKIESKGVNIEELIETMESKVKENKGKQAIILQSPPSPDDLARRKVFDDWGEYFDRESGRPFYYNTKTREKRWKPPRKSVCSPVITNNSPPTFPKEVNSHSKSMKVPSPTYPSSTSNNAWPFRDRSFTDSGPRSNESFKLDVSDKDAGGAIACSPKMPSKSIFSSISSSISFMKSTSPPQVPPSSSKPQLGGISSSCPTSPVTNDISSPTFPPSYETGQNISLLSALERFHVPRGWIRKYDALSQQIYFQSLVSGEKWNLALDKSGTVYVYPPNGGESKWSLQEYDNFQGSSSSPVPSLQSSEAGNQSIRHDYLNWRFNLKQRKKVKKTWIKSFANYYPTTNKTTLGKSYGRITFTKRPNDLKKLDQFDLVPDCHIDSNLKKPNTICLHNGEGTEILLQAEYPNVVAEWAKVLIEKEKLQERVLTSDKEKRNHKSLVKKESSDELDSTKGIKDSLILFFKKRIQQETLAKKGIYKDTVFGSTIGDICIKEKVKIPLFVLKCINYIERDEANFKMDGLYRISGNASKIQKIRIEIAQSRYVILEEEKDVHNLTGALKLFFRELKEPLIPFVSYQSFIQATGIEYLKNKTRSEALRQAVKKLPECNRDTMKLLLQHLLKINEYEHENRMSIMNLAIVFGPCLLWPETTSGYDLMTDAMLHNRVVEGLLSDFDEIFKSSK